MNTKEYVMVEWVDRPRRTGLFRWSAKWEVLNEGDVLISGIDHSCSYLRVLGKAHESARFAALSLSFETM